MEIVNDYSYVHFVSKIKKLIEDENYDELFKNCRDFLIKYDKDTFDYFQTIEERYYSKSDSVINVVDDLLNFLNDIALIYNNDIYKIDLPYISAIILFLAMLSYMFVEVDLSMNTYTNKEFDYSLDYIEYLPVKINSQDLAINEIMYVSMNSNLGQLKSDIIKKIVDIDTTKINIEYHKYTILMDNEFIIYSFNTPIKNLFYTGKIKPGHNITFINIDSLPQFSYPIIFENQPINTNYIQNVTFNSLPLNQRVHFDFHYMTSLENWRSIFRISSVIFERYQYIIVRETDFNIKFILII